MPSSSYGRVPAIVRNVLPLHLILLLLPVGCGSDLDLGTGVPSSAAAPPTHGAPPPITSAGPPAFDGGAPHATTFGDEATALGERWTWMDPTPTGEPMYVTAGTSMSDLFYAGAAGTVLHWDGVTWDERATDMNVTLDMAWAPEAGSVWLAGLDAAQSGRLFRMTGKMAVEDTALKGFSIQALTGLGPSRAWAVGPRGEVRAWNGATWSTVRAPSPNDNWLRGLHAFSPSDVWGAGDKGEIVHFDGAAWTTATWDGSGENPFDPDLRYEGIWGASPTDLWAVGVHFTAAPTPIGALQHLPVFSHYDGTRWTVLAHPDNVCGDQAGYGGQNGTWWDGLVTSFPSPESSYYDVRRPYGPSLVGTDAANVLFQGNSMCPWRFDGARWVAEPQRWYRVGDTFQAYFFAARPSVAALAARTLVDGDSRFEPTASDTPLDGMSPRWRPLRPATAQRGNLVLTQAGGLWSAQIGVVTVEEWTPLGWASLGWPPGLTGYAQESRQLFVRDASDVWVGDAIDRNAPTRHGVLHWNGSEAALVPLTSGADVVQGNLAHVWTLALSGVNGPLRHVSLLGDGGVLADAEVESSLGLGPHSSGHGDILAESKGSDRMLYAFPISKRVGVADCIIGSWDGAGPARLELAIEHCSASPSYGLPYFGTRLARLADGTLGVLVPGALWTWTDGGTTARQRIEATFAGGVLTLRAGSTIATLANPTGFAPGLQDIGPAGGDRYWIVAGGGLFLWDAEKDEIALARHASALTSIVVNEANEAWAVGPGLLHFTPPLTPITGDGRGTATSAALARDLHGKLGVAAAVGREGAARR